MKTPKIFLLAVAITVSFALVARAQVLLPPQAASQAEVNAGIVRDKFVSPATLANKPGGGGGGVIWGGITGTLTNQTDLVTALSLKAPLVSPAFTTPNIGVATGTSLTSGKVIVSENSNLGAYDFSNSGFSVVSNDAANKASVDVIAIGGWPPQFAGVYANGTISSPTATVSGNAIWRAVGRGYGGANWVSGNHSIFGIFAIEDFTDSAAGTAFRVDTVPIGTVNRASVLRADNLSLTVYPTTASTSTTTGSGIFGGGLGVAGAGFFGGTVNVETTDTYSFIARRANAGGNTSMRRSQGSLASPTIIANGNIIHQLVWQGYDGTSAYQDSAMISAAIDGATISATSMPGRLMFSTVPSGAVANVERMRISQTGVVSVAVAVASTSKDTGALVVDNGGLGVEGAINAGGAIAGSNLSGTNTGDQNLFGSIIVSGQTTVTAASNPTALTLVAGSNMTITTNNTTKTVTLAASGGGGGGDVSVSGTPTTGQIAVWTDATTIGGVDDLVVPGTVITGGSGTGAVTIKGATSGSLILTGVDAMAQDVTISLAAQTSGAATLTLPDFAGASQTFSFIGKAETLSGAKTFSGGILASGANANDWSGGSGTFKTSTGAVTIGTGAVGITGITTFTPPVRASGVAAYFTLNTPADTGQTAATESIGMNLVTATRTWATTGTVALQRERFFAGPTYASASASQTFTDAFNLYLTPPIAGTNAIFTRGHTLGIVDPTSASSSITGGLIVSAAVGTTATSVGIGGGNVNAGATITGVTLAGTTIEVGLAATDATISRVGAGQIAVEGVNIVTTSSADTLTNKRISARITSITSSATPTVNTDNCDCVTITALAAAITSMTTNLTGTPVNFDQLEYRIKDDGTARAITWGASFASGPTALPTTTVLGKALHVWLEWDSAQSKWVCMASGSDA